MRSLAVWLIMALVMECALVALSEVDIDYSHTVVGTGTLITDYRMGAGAEQSSEASGKVRGTGNVMNKYVFLSENHSQNVTIEDQFTLSSKSAGRNLSVDNYPSMPIEPERFLLTGTSWAENLMIAGTVNNTSLRNAGISLQPASQGQNDPTKNDSYSTISNSNRLDANVFPNIDEGEKIFDYKSSWYNSSNNSNSSNGGMVAAGSLAGGPK